MMRESKIKDENEFYSKLTRELSVAIKNLKDNDFIYHNNVFYYIAVIKFRMKDDNSNFGKSKGWRVVAIIDNINGIFILLDFYKHSKGKDNLTENEKKIVKEMCDEYAKIGE